MVFDHNNADHQQVVEEEEDRLSNLPDDLIHKILSCFDMKFAVQTGLLSSKWKLLWTSMSCLNFSRESFGSFRKFEDFVTHVLSHRNHQVEVTSVKLNFHEVTTLGFLEKIVNYAFSHNAQELIISVHSGHYFYPLCLFSSQSLKHCTLTGNYMKLCNNTTKTPLLDFPALTTLNLSHIKLCGDVFSKCVNLKSLTLKRFNVVGQEEAFDIIAPRLSNLMLVSGYRVKTINVIAPQLENLTIINCSIKYLNAPSGLSSLSYTLQFLWSDGVVKFSNDPFYSLNKVDISLSMSYPYMEEDARQTINMLQKLQSARYLTLNADTVECISSFPELLSQNPSPFSNLICLTIDYSMRKDANEATMSSEATTFLLDNSPNATLIMKLPNQGTFTFI